MSIAFTYYANVRNKYCLAYYGLAPEYVLQLRILRPIIREEFPELQVSISCLDEFMFMLEGEEETYSFSSIPEMRNNFAYIREITINMEPPHAIHQIITESIRNPVVTPPPAKEQVARRCLICPDGATPTASYANCERLKTYASSKGYSVKVAGSDIHPGHAKVDWRPAGLEKMRAVADADWVIGVENELVYQAAYSGIKTSLIPTGIGTELFKTLCPKGEILRL